jgi:N-acetyl-gamma-glutamyl-phosphate reductase common form
VSAATKIPAVVLGGTGYVSGELLRLFAAHPQFDLRAVLSDSQPGEPLAKFFAHLAPIYPTLKFSSLEDTLEMIGSQPQTAVISAAPHGISAGLIDKVLSVAERKGTQVRVVDISADFRYTSAAAYEAVYKHAHGAPARIEQFTCAVPEHIGELSTLHACHPGCFATSVLLASVPLLQLGLVEPRLFAAGITGSSGSGRQPGAGTHHPQRHSDLYAYNPLGHRHTPEIAALAHAASGVAAEFNFIPHSGPFVRGIHTTVQAVSHTPIKTGELLEALQHYYRNAPFVRVGAEMPHVKDVAGSNYSFLSAAANGKSVAVMCVIDNLVKGAAGGALQLLNRLYGLDDAAGLTAPAPGWT